MTVVVSLETWSFPALISWNTFAKCFAYLRDHWWLFGQKRHPRTRPPLPLLNWFRSQSTGRRKWVS